LGARFSDKNVLISQEAKSYYESHFRKTRNIVIYNPLDNKLINKEIYYRNNSSALISVGRLTYQKNYHLLIEIAEKVLAKHDGWVWHIYGDGEQREELEALIAEKRLTEKVVLMGNVADLYDRYPSYAGIVMTSRWEGFPMVLIEAAANGLPMISLDIATGPKEIIEDSVNGFLIPEGDINSFISKLDIFMNEPEMREKFSRAASQKVASFRVENIVNQWCKLFLELIEQDVK
jgi:glycosyltransferase involved in cell wall biosynthesis